MMLLLLTFAKSYAFEILREHHLRVILPKIQPTGKEGFKETFVLPNAEGRDVTYALESPDEPVPSDSNSTQSTKRKKSVKGKSIDKRSKPCPSNSEDIQDSQKLICEKCGFDAKTPGNLKSHIFNVLEFYYRCYHIFTTLFKYLLTC